MNPLFLRDRSVVFLAAILSQCLLTLGCTQTSRPEVNLGKPIYRTFDADSIEKISWKALSVGGQSVYLEISAKTENLGHSSYKVPAYQINKAPIALLDNEANSGFIKHWLETLKTFTPREYVITTELSRVGLKPPEHEFKFFTPTYVMQFALGERTKIQGTSGLAGRMASFDLDRDQQPTVLKIEGAFLRMLDLVEDWQKLRRAKAFSRDLDDVDEFTISDMDGKQTLERNGTQWEKAGFRPLPEEPALEMLKHLFNQQITAYIDDESHQQEIRKACERQFQNEISLTYLQGDQETLKLCELKESPVSSKHFALSSNKKFYWAVYPEFNQSFLKLTKLFRSSKPKRR